MNPCWSHMTMLYHSDEKKSFLGLKSYLLLLPENANFFPVANSQEILHKELQFSRRCFLSFKYIFYFLFVSDPSDQRTSLTQVKSILQKLDGGVGSHVHAHLSLLRVLKQNAISVISQGPKNSWFPGLNPLPFALVMDLPASEPLHTGPYTANHRSINSYNGFRGNIYGCC